MFPSSRYGFVVLILERISLRVRHTGHIQIVIVLKLLLLVLQIRHRNDVVVLIVRKRLPEALLKQGQAVEKMQGSRCGNKYRRPSRWYKQSLPRTRR